MVATVDVPAGRPGETVDYVGVFKRLSWGAIIAGALVALAIHAMLTLLGVGIGLGIAYPTLTPLSATTFGVGAAIWEIIITIIALFIGGWVTAYLARTSRQADGALHGLITWSLATVLTLVALNSTLAMLGSAAISNPNLRDNYALNVPPAGRVQQPGAAERDAGTQGTINVEKTTSRASGTAIATFLILIVGAAASLIGGYVGSNADYYDWMRRQERTDVTDRTTTP